MECNPLSSLDRPPAYIQRCTRTDDDNDDFHDGDNDDDDYHIGDNDDGDDHDGENDDGELVIISCSAKGPDMIICMIIVIFRMVINESKDYILNINEFIDSGHLVSEKTWE